jgi:hypothetical protein
MRLEGRLDTVKKESAKTTQDCLRDLKLPEAKAYLGGEMGFVEADLLVFESKSANDCHKDTDGRTSVRWFAVLPCLEVKAVTVMDNIPYHAVMVSKIQNQS